jgi:hypothetical protein
MRGKYTFNDKNSSSSTTTKIKMSGLWPDQPQIRNIPDRALALATQNPLSPDKDIAISKGKNPLFSGQTYGGASGGLSVPSFVNIAV